MIRPQYTTPSLMRPIFSWGVRSCQSEANGPASTSRRSAPGMVMSRFGAVRGTGPQRICEACSRLIPKASLTMGSFHVARRNPRSNSAWPRSCCNSTSSFRSSLRGRVAGGGEVGFHLAKALIEAAHEVVVIESDRRRAAIESLHAQVGACRAGSGFDRVENALRGDWTMSCERGRLRVAITLAPTMPPTVQFLSVTLAPSADAPRPGTCPQ